MNDYMPDDVDIDEGVGKDVDADLDRQLKPGDICVSDQRGTRLSTRALGSSVAVGVYDPQAHVIGLAHILYSTAKTDNARSRKSLEQRPGMFADTAINCLFEEMEKLGSRVEDGACIVSLVGAAGMLGEMRSFAHGASVVEAVRQQLQTHGVTAAAEDLDGTRVRFMSVYGENGDMCVAVNGQNIKLV